MVDQAAYFQDYTKCPPMFFVFNDLKKKFEICIVLSSALNEQLEQKHVYYACEETFFVPFLEESIGNLHSLCKQ
jgi:hypothetical protein